MLSPEELAAWYKQVNVSQQGRSVIDHVRSSEPARRVGGGRRNVSRRYPSRKMGVTIQFESHRVGMPFGVLHRVPGAFPEGGYAGYGDPAPPTSAALARILDNHEKAGRTLGVGSF